MHSSKMVRLFVYCAQPGVRIDSTLTVATGPKGTYVDSSEVKVPRLKCVVSTT